MAWTRLDDDTVVTDQPLSAFVGKRLTDNVSTYNIALARSATFAYPTTSAGAAKVKWASAFERIGTVVTIDAGRFSNNFVFKVFYKTTNAALGGTIYVRDLDSGVITSAVVPGSATPTSIEIPYLTTGVSGMRGFHIGFESDVSASVGSVILTGAVANQVFCEPTTPVAQFPFTLGLGSYTEMYHLLGIGSASTSPAPLERGLPLYQVCAFRRNTAVNAPPAGVLVVWPNLENIPPILPTSTTGATPGSTVNPTGTLFELGRLELFSITVEMDWPANDRLLPPYAYQQPTPINRLNNSINAAMIALQPNAAMNLTSDGYLGYVLPAGDELTFCFFIQTDESVQQLLTTFRAVAYNQAQDAPDITFGVRDAQGNTVGTDITQESVPVPRITGQTTFQSQANASVAMNGVLAGDEKWGMRDAMPVQDAMMGFPIRFTWGPNVATEIAWGQDASVDTVYYGTITATADLYIYGFNCKVQ